LLKGGEPDIHNVCVTIIRNWQRGAIPFFSKAPNAEETAKEKADAAEKAVVQGETTLFAKPIMEETAEEIAAKEKAAKEEEEVKE